MKRARESGCFTCLNGHEEMISTHCCCSTAPDEGPLPYFPQSTRFEQVHLARRFGASNLVKTPFAGALGKANYKPYAIVRMPSLYIEEVANRRRERHKARELYKKPQNRLMLL